jgi:hypothetical protein
MKPTEQDWQQWDGESRAAFRCFEAYLDGGTIREAAKKAGCKYATAETWSIRYRWAKRRGSHDRYLSDQSRKKGDAAIIAARARHASQDHAVAQVLLTPAIELSRRIQAGKFDIEALTDKELIELTIRAGSVLPRVQESERLCLGDVEGYRPIQPDAAPDELTQIVEEDNDARALAARLIQRVGDVQQSLLEEEVRKETERRAKAEGTSANRDWNGSRPSIHHEHFDPTTPSMLKEDAPLTAVPGVVEPEPVKGPTPEEEKAARARAAKARESK